MTTIPRRLVLVLGLLVLAIPCHASTIPVTFQFGNPTWSGTASFDDTTGVPWSIGPFLTAYEIVDLEISDGVRTWTEDELDPFFHPPGGGLLVDSTGRAALFVIPRDASTGAYLESSVSLSDPIVFTEFVTLLLPNAVSQSTYIASVAAVTVPSTLWLVAFGLAAFGGVAWRRRQ